MARRADPERLGRLGASIALGLVALLVVWVVAIDNLVALVVVAPAAVGGALALTWPRIRVVALAAAALISVTAVLGLIGYWGLAFVPSIVLLVIAGVRGRSG